jgi:hypothetical protein
VHDADYMDEDPLDCVDFRRSGLVHGEVVLVRGLLRTPRLNNRLGIVGPAVPGADRAAVSFSDDVPPVAVRLYNLVRSPCCPRCATLIGVLPACLKCQFGLNADGGSLPLPRTPARAPMAAARSPMCSQDLPRPHTIVLPVFDQNDEPAAALGGLPSAEPLLPAATNRHTALSGDDGNTYATDLSFDLAVPTRTPTKTSSSPPSEMAAFAVLRPAGSPAVRCCK